MKVSALIAALQLMLKEHGDLPVLGCLSEDDPVRLVQVLDARGMAYEGGAAFPAREVFLQ
jgi:hypothetical protein